MFKLHYTSKFLEYQKNAQRLAKLLDGHPYALAFLERTHQLGHLSCNCLEIQNTHKSLLGTPGISKTLIGLHDIAQEIQQTQEIYRDLGNIAYTPAFLNLDSDFAHSLNNLASLMSPISVDSDLINQFRETLKINSQIPFIDRLRTKIPQIGQLLTNTNRIAEITYSEPFVQSALIVATTSINFSANLENFSYVEQLRIVNALDSLKLDTNIEILEELPAELKSDYITLTEFAHSFWQDNRTYILGILATAYPTINGFCENDFSNIFVVILFTYYCSSLVYNSLKTPNENQEKK